MMPLPPHRPSRRRKAATRAKRKMLVHKTSSTARDEHKMSCVREEPVKPAAEKRVGFF